MAIASQRITNLKAWIRRKIVGFFADVKTKAVRLVRGNRGNGSTGSNDIELTGEEKDFQVV